MHVLDLGEQAPGLGGGLDAALDALEQAHLQPVLGIGQQPADRGLRDRQHPRRTADRAGDHDGAKHLDLAQIEFHPRLLWQPPAHA